MLDGPDARLALDGLDEHGRGVGGHHLLEHRVLARHHAETGHEPRVRRHHVVALERLELGQRHGKILVPIPASVNSSSSSECGSRPSMMCAAVTPPSTACAQAASLGRIPPVTAPMRSRTSAAVAWAIRVVSSAGSSSQAGTSVRKIALEACMATATAAAASSALML